jgi:hypothetical protein
MEPFTTTGLFSAPSSPYIVGLDLGKSADFSALIPLRKTGVKVVPDSDRKPLPVYAVRAVKRWSLNTAYTTVIEDVVRLFADREFAGGHLVIDATGVGAGVVDSFRQAKPAATIHSIVITGGHTESRRPNNVRHVSKTILIHLALMCVLQERIKFARRIPEADVIKRELSNYTMRISPSANETYSARDSEHDDLVLALALAVYLGDRRGSEARVEVLDLSEAARAEAEQAEAPAVGPDGMTDGQRSRLPGGEVWPGGPSLAEYKAALEELMRQPPRFDGDGDFEDGWAGWR